MSQIKRITISFEDDFYEAIRLAVFQGRTTMRALITEAVAVKLGIPAPTQVAEEDESDAA